jgi:hypothetical protein
MAKASWPNDRNRGMRKRALTEEAEERQILEDWSRPRRIPVRRTKAEDRAIGEEMVRQLEAKRREQCNEEDPDQ